jgi:CRP/FNR family cyclic AMP-dependent transcriptional regulator
MKSFNWPDLLRGHLIFSSLTEEEVTHLLRDDASLEKNYPPDSLILRQGEAGDSICVIGSGSVQVVVSGTPVAVLEKGEIFGEIAALERKPRSATVTAREHCLLLEISGEEFRQLLVAHSDMNTKVRAKMSARLNQAN